MDLEDREQFDARMRGFFEQAEVGYLKAKAAGLADPVIIITGVGPDGEGDSGGPLVMRADDEPRPYHMAYAERSEAARQVGDQPEAVAMVCNPAPGYGMTVLIFDDDGLTIHDCVAPE